VIGQLVHLLGYEFVQNALLAGILVAVVAGLVSRFAAVRFAGRVAALLAGLYFIYLAASIAISRAR